MNVSDSTEAMDSTDEIFGDTSIPEESTHFRHTRPNRSIKPPIWHKDYLVSKSTKQSLKDVPYSITNYAAYSKISPSYMSFLTALSSIKEPATFKEASGCPEWIKAMQDEVNALEQNATWTVVDLPPGKKAIGSKWIYKVKLQAYG